MRVFQNGNFYSCEDGQPRFSTLVEDRGRIVYTGEGLPERYAGGRSVDLNGRTVVPAFADTHLHFQSYALFQTTVDVRDAADFDEMGRLLRSYAQTHPDETFVPAYGCSAHTLAEGRLPQRADLDRMLPERPLLIVKYDGHAAVANSLLIGELPAEVTGDAGFEADTGWMYQNAFYKGVNFITEKVHPLRLLKGMQSAADALAAKGIGTLHACEGVGYKNDLDIDTMLAARYGLPQNIKVFFQTDDVEQATRRGLARIGGCFRLALDGCFGSEDAAVSGGYAHDPANKGFLLYTQEEVDSFCIQANRAGLQIALHAIGDVAVQQALAAYEAALRDTPRVDHRHIVIHADLIPPPLIRKAAQLGVGIALQPAFLRWKQEPPEYLARILGPRSGELLPLRDLLDAGVLLSAGSDAPCTLPDPLASLYHCVRHPNPAQSITLEEALKMHTLWAAEMGFDEEERGSLRPGKVADFVVLAQDPFQHPPEELLKNRILATYLNGKRVEPGAKPGLAKLAARVVRGRLRGRQH